MQNLIVLIVLLFVSSSGLYVHTNKGILYSHSKATFGVDIGNNTYTGRLKEISEKTECKMISIDLNNSIALIHKQSSKMNCTVAHQIDNVEKMGAIGVVVMNQVTGTYFESFEVVTSPDKDKYNISIPIVGILSSEGIEILNYMKSNSSLCATISIDGEFPMTIWDFVFSFVIVICIMYGGMFLISFLNRLSSCVKRMRRSNYVKQIKTSHYSVQKHKDLENLPSCSICLCDFVEKDSTKTLRCGHYFHSDCIDPWLINEKALCPVCRQGIFMEDDWNLLEESQNREIDLLLYHVEERMPNTLSNIFSCAFCISLIGYLAVAILIK